MSAVREKARTTPTLVAFVSVAVLVVFKLLRRWRRQRCFSWPSGYRGLPFFGETFAFIADPTSFAAKRLRDFGGSFRTNFLFKEHVVLEPTETNLKFFTGQKDLGWPPHFLDLVGRTSLPMVNDPIHKRMRIVSSRAFTQQHLDEHLVTFHTFSQKHLQRWVQWPESRDVRQDLKFYTFEMAHKIILGIEPLEGETRHYLQLFNAFLSGLASIMPVDYPGFPFRKAMNARRELAAIYQRVIDERRAQPPEVPACMLDHVMASDNQEGGAASDMELQDFCVAMVFAGHDTTLSTLQTELHVLSRNPGIVRELRAEVDAAWDGQAQVSRAVLQRLHKCRAFSLEVMRLNPPVQMLSRTLKTDTAVGSYRLPAGTGLGLSAKSVTDHRFPNPEQFRLENYLDEEGSFVDRTHDFASCSVFGCGSRMCLGYRFALDEMTVFLLNLLHGYTVLVEESERVPFPFNSWRLKARFATRPV